MNKKLKLVNLNAKTIGLAISFSLIIPPNFGINIFGINLEDIPLIILLVFLIFYKFKNFIFSTFDKYSLFIILFFIIYTNIFTYNHEIFNQTNLRFYFYFIVAYLSIDRIIFTESKITELFESLWLVMISNFVVIIFQIQLPGTIDGWILGSKSFLFLPPGRLGGIQGGGPNVIGVICALYVLLCTNKILSSENKINYFARNKLNSLLLIISIFNLFFTFSRGSFLALGVGFIISLFLEESITKKNKYLFLVSLIIFALISVIFAPTIFLKQSNRIYLSTLAINNTELLRGVGGGFYVQEVYKDYLITLDEQFLLENFDITYDDVAINLDNNDEFKKIEDLVDGYLKLDFEHKKGVFSRSVIKFYFSNDGIEWTQIGSNFSTGTVINLIENNSFFEVGGWADGQSPDDSYLDGFINEVKINVSDKKNTYLINEKNRDKSYFVLLPASQEFYDNRNDGKLIFNEKGLKLLRPRSYWVAIPNEFNMAESDFEIILKLSLNNIPKGNETLFSQSSILSSSGQANDQSWKWSIVNGKMYFFWIENITEGYSNYLGGQSLRSETLIIRNGNLDKVQSDFSISQYDEITTSHNGFLTMAVEYGALIVIMILSTLIFLIYKNFHKINKVELGLIGILLIQNLTNDLIYAPDIAILFWMIPFYFASKIVKNQ